MGQCDIHGTLVRALKMYFALARSRFGMTVDDLRVEIDCTRRTVYRYLNALEQAGVEITTKREGNGKITRQVVAEGQRREDRAVIAGYPQVAAAGPSRRGRGK